MGVVLNKLKSKGLERFLRNKNDEEKNKNKAIQKRDKMADNFDGVGFMEEKTQRGDIHLYLSMLFRFLYCQASGVDLDMCSDMNLHAIHVHTFHPVLRLVGYVVANIEASATYEFFPLVISLAAAAG